MREAQQLPGRSEVNVRRDVTYALLFAEGSWSSNIVLNAQLEGCERHNLILKSFESCGIDQILL